MREREQKRNEAMKRLQRMKEEAAGVTRLLEKVAERMRDREAGRQMRLDSKLDRESARRWKSGREREREGTIKQNGKKRQTRKREERGDCHGF